MYKIIVHCVSFQFFTRFLLSLSLLGASFFISLAAHAKDQADSAYDVLKGIDPVLIAWEIERRMKLRRGERVPNFGGQRRAVAKKLKDFSEEELVLAARRGGEEREERIIYGKDNRKEFYQIKNAKVKELAKSAVALFVDPKVEKFRGDNFRLKARTLGAARKLCRSQDFLRQYAGAYCSGTLIEDDLVLTAGHCFKEITKSSKRPSVKDMKFVFGFHVTGPKSYGQSRFSESHVFIAKSVEGVYKNGVDWALVRLKKPVPPHIAKPVKGWSRDKVRRRQDVFVLGYPSGLPLKYAPGAKVRDNREPHFFTANLDTFGGNSGSGVYDMKTKKLIGVLVRGGVDYVYSKVRKCHIVNVCPSSGCRGEDVLRLSEVPMPGR